MDRNVNLTLIKPEQENSMEPPAPPSIPIDIEIVMASTDPTIVESSSSNKELIKSAILPVHPGDCLLMRDIIALLKSKGYHVKNAVFSYYSPSQGLFVYSGKEAAKEFYQIPLKEVVPKMVLKVRSAAVVQPIVAAPSPQGGVKVKAEKKEHSRRNKERKIGEIIEKVSEWRALYTGTTDASGRYVKHSLEDAAKVVGIAKKTLDDYLLQLRAGKKYKFDFQSNKDAKVGVLRAFVKEKKKGEKDLKQSASDHSAGDGNEVFGDGDPRANAAGDVQF